jgi:hypothetical protein
METSIWSLCRPINFTWKISNKSRVEDRLEIQKYLAKSKYLSGGLFMVFYL